jgi:sterol desaturase/sphingolipid hydroxylase (fatty acid hydroxylase superfamily)
MSIPLLVGGAGLIMIFCERVWTGRSFPRVRGWWPRAILLNGLQVAATYLAGVAWDGWMANNRLWSADGLGTMTGAIVGYLVMTFIYYWWHRWRHTIPFLWRWVHQVHHSPQRIEIITSFYKHPIELVLNGVLSSAILYLLVGLGPVAAAQAVLLSGLAELVYHWNVRTPHWLGYIFQRPESHCVHHQADHHAENYGDLPLWDMMFGTFHNPRDWSEQCGFGEAEHQLPAMLIGRDVLEA